MSTTKQDFERQFPSTNPPSLHPSVTGPSPDSPKATVLWQFYAIPSVEELVEIYRKGFFCAIEPIWTQELAHKNGIAAVRKAMVDAIVPSPAPPDVPKPEPRRIPLCAGDVPPGSAISTTAGRESWWMVTWVGNYVCCANAIAGGPVTFQRLMDDGFTILRPGSTEWVECWKEA